MPRIRAVLFDLDGVIVDSFPVWFQALNESLRHFGHQEMDENFFREKIWVEPHFQAAAKKHMPNVDVKALYSNIFPNIQERFKDISLMEGVKGVMSDLRGSYRLGIVTNGQKRPSMFLVEKFGLNVDVVVTKEDVVEAKPNPEMIILACDKLFISPTEAVVVGDMQFDLIAAKAAGAIPVGFRIKSEHSINELSQLPRMIGEINGRI